MNCTARGLLVAAASAGLVLASAPAATAAPPVNKHSCEAQGGTFSTNKGTRTCTVRTVDRASTTMDSTSSPVQPDGYNYHGVYYVSTFCYTETTTSQRGNETPTRTIKLCSVHAPELGREISPTSCLADRVEDGRLIRENRPISECEALGLYPESTFVGE